MDNEKMGRRKFIGAVMLAAIAIPTVVAAESAKVGTRLLGESKEGALGQCGSGTNCAGGGGKCGYGSSCAGGGGKCGSSTGCAGGGGKCGYGSHCAGS